MLVVQTHEYTRCIDRAGSAGSLDTASLRVVSIVVVLNRRPPPPALPFPSHILRRVRFSHCQSKILFEPGRKRTIVRGNLIDRRRQQQQDNTSEQIRQQRQRSSNDYWYCLPIWNQTILLWKRFICKCNTKKIPLWETRVIKRSTTTKTRQQHCKQQTGQHRATSINKAYLFRLSKPSPSPM